MSTTEVKQAEGLGSAPGEHPTFQGSIDLPYKLTLGRAAGTFIAELANQRLVGSRFAEAGETLVPAQDFHGDTGEEQPELVVVPSTGTLTGFTELQDAIIGLVQIDGTDSEFAHKVLDAQIGDLTIGQRVEARWADEATGSVLDLAGFAPSDSEAPAEVELTPLQSDTEPLTEMPYEMHLKYDHSYGPHYGRLFDDLATHRRIIGSKSPRTGKVLVPPREFDETTFERTVEWVDVPDTGVLQAFSVIHLEFVGQTREPPYIYAEIVLDGSNTRLIHALGGIDPLEAPDRLRCGMRVKAVWNEAREPTGTLEDILHFEVLEDEAIEETR